MPDFGSNFADPAAGVPLDLSSQVSNNPGPVPADTPAPQPAAPDGGSPSFGSMFSGAMRGLPTALGGPSYTPPDANAPVLDQSADLLKQRIKRANSIATNPLAQIFAPEQVQAAREFVPKATQDLQTIEQQRQHAADVRTTARNWGLTNPNQFGEQATDTTLANEALRQWKDEGNFNAYKALAGLSAEWKNRADLYMPDAMSKFDEHVTAVQRGITTLNSAAAMNNEQAFSAARDKIVKDNDLSALGVKEGSIPKTIDEWMARRGSLEAQYNAARTTLNAFKARQDQLNQAVPVHDEKVAKTVESNYQFGNGETIPGFKAVSLPGYGDVQGVMGPPGSRDTANRGVTWSNASPEQVKTVREQLGAEEVKGALGKYKIAREFNDTAQNDKMYKSTAGIALLSDELGAIGRDVAEGSKAAGTVGLTKMLEAKYGTVDNARNRLNLELAALKEWYTKGGTSNPRLSPPSIEGIKAVAKFKHDEALKEVQDRVNQPLETAGRYGMLLKNLGLDRELTEDPALRGTYDSALKQGNRELDSYPMVTIGDRRVLLPTGSNVPGAKVAPLTPVQPGVNTAPAGGQQPAPAGPQFTPPSPPAGAVQPVTIAGQQVNAPQLPQGATPLFLQMMQGIESGGQRDPWTAATKNSSASGAFQFINKTWADNKPAGAPARAADATPQQQTEAAVNLANRNATALKSANVPVTDRNLYVAHNLGADGGTALLRASPDDDARSIVGEVAARNNPQFFKGRPTVATVLQRYADAMAQPHQMTGRDRQRQYLQSVRTGGGPDLSNESATPVGQAWRNVGTAAVDNAPAIGSTVGAIGGGIVGDVPGAIGGGAAGGAAGQAFKDYMQGKPQNPREIAKQAALGGVLGVASEARPVVAAAARVAGAGAVEAADTAAKGESDLGEAAATGLAYGLGGEALARFIRMAGAGAYKVLQRYTPTAQKELSAQAGKLSEARATLESEKPDLPGDAGPNPKYEAAKKQADDATAAIKEHGQDPDDMVHAYEQAKAGVPAGEAATMRGAESEKRQVGAGYDQLREDVRGAGVGTPKPNQQLLDGPVAQLRTAENATGKVDERFRADAEHAELLIKAPAKDWGEKWQQLQTAGSELVKKRMDFLQNGEKTSAKAMDDLFEGVRNQQKAAAEYVFGKKKGAEVIGQLEKLDERYAKVMNATAGMKYEKMRSILASGNTPERRELEKNFREFAKDDPAAIRAFNAMKAGAGGDWQTEAKLMIPIIAGEAATNMSGVPTLGVISAAVAGHRLYRLMQGYMNAKVLGQSVKFKDFLVKEIKSAGVTNAAAGAGRRATVQGQPELAPGL